VNEADLRGYASRVGDLIVMRAHDDFDVRKVSVALTGASGNASDTRGLIR
jgi:hypothetical protein